MRRPHRSRLHPSSRLRPLTEADGEARRHVPHPFGRPSRRFRELTRSRPGWRARLAEHRTGFLAAAGAVIIGLLYILAAG